MITLEVVKALLFLLLGTAFAFAPTYLEIKLEQRQKRLTSQEDSV